MVCAQQYFLLHSVSIHDLFGVHLQFVWISFEVCVHFLLVLNLFYVCPIFVISLHATVYAFTERACRPVVRMQSSVTKVSELG